MFCSNGHPTSVNSKFCGQCGSPTNNNLNLNANPAPVAVFQEERPTKSRGNSNEILTTVREGVFHNLKMKGILAVAVLGLFGIGAAFVNNVDGPPPPPPSREEQFRSEVVSDLEADGVSRGLANCIVDYFLDHYSLYQLQEKLTGASDIDELILETQIAWTCRAYILD